eukprot:XP_011618888.1 PREDICTED: patatin-like phospholipase domain-containing protein 7 [Takifugu rubripes]
MLKDRHQEEFHNTQTRSNVVTCPNASFTDLAEIVSRIEPIKPAVVDDESDYHTDYEEEALESALSDLELCQQAWDHTEGEETADTDEDLDRSSAEPLTPPTGSLPLETSSGQEVPE